MVAVEARGPVAVAELLSLGGFTRMEDNQHQPKPKADMPPPRKPPDRTTIAGVGGGDDKPKKKYETVRIVLPPKPTPKLPPKSSTS